MTRPHYQMILHMALYPLLRRDGEGRGRDEDCSSPPTQIRAGGFPAPGSCLRSNVIGLRSVTCRPWLKYLQERKNDSQMGPAHTQRG